jgi:phage head maturation protease
MNLPTQYRQLTFQSGAIDEQARTIEFTFSSTAPYERSWGVEVLDHSPGAMIDERFKQGAVPFLLNHKWDDQIGRVLQHGIRNNKGYAVVKVSRSAEGEEIWNDVKDGIRNNISVGYIVHEMKEIEKSATNMSEAWADKPCFLVTKWEALEISLVSVPADASVGIGRGHEYESEKQTKNALEQREWSRLATPAVLEYIDRHGGLEHLGKLWKGAGFGNDFSEMLRAIASRQQHLADLFPGGVVC